eukprot:1834506-Rhodomonas_salina.2
MEGLGSGEAVHRHSKVSELVTSVGEEPGGGVGEEKEDDHKEQLQNTLAVRVSGCSVQGCNSYATAPISHTGLQTGEGWRLSASVCLAKFLSHFLCAMSGTWHSTKPENVAL